MNPLLTSNHGKKQTWLKVHAQHSFLGLGLVLFQPTWSVCKKSVRQVLVAGHIDWNAVLSIQSIVLSEVIYTERFHRISSRFSKLSPSFREACRRATLSPFTSLLTLYIDGKCILKAPRIIMLIVIHRTLALTCLIIYSSGQKMPKTESVLCQKTCGTPKLFLQQLVPVHWRE